MDLKHAALDSMIRLICRCCSVKRARALPALRRSFQATSNGPSKSRHVQLNRLDASQLVLLHLFGAEPAAPSFDASMLLACRSLRPSLGASSSAWPHTNGTRCVHSRQCSHDHLPSHSRGRMTPSGVYGAGGGQCLPACDPAAVKARTMMQCSGVRPSNFCTPISVTHVLRLQ